jgi:hypothetical protein
VQEHLSYLVTENRNQIDASIASLNTVGKTLAANRGNLARTLCTLPMGVASYAQTSSWGEMFNVRIVEVFVQDRDSNPIVQRSELPQQRGDTATPSVSGCERFFKGTGAGSTYGDTPLPGGLGDDLGSLVDFVLQDGDRR